jgi:hypothetical protein
VQAEALQQLAQVVARDAGRGGGVRQVAGMGREQLGEVAGLEPVEEGLLGLLEGEGVERLELGAVARGGRGRGGGAAEVEVGRLDEAAGEVGGALDRVLELADVAGPAVGLEGGAGVRVELLGRGAVGDLAAGSAR